MKKQFQNRDFSYFGHIEFILDSFKEYIKITQKEIFDIESRLKEIDSLYEKFGNEFDFDSLYGDSEQVYIEENVTQIYYESIFMAIYSFVEKTMKRLCEIAKNNSSELNQITLNDMNHKGIELYYVYLKKVHKINFDNVNESWNMLKSFNTLRNLIIHDPSKEIEKIEKNIKKIEKLKKIRNLTIVENDKLITFSIKNKEVLEEFIFTVKNFFRNVYYN